MHTEWRCPTPLPRHSFDLHICLGSSERGKQGVIFVHVSWLTTRTRQRRLWISCLMFLCQEVLLSNNRLVLYLLISPACQDGGAVGLDILGFWWCPWTLLFHASLLFWGINPPSVVPSLESSNARSIQGTCWLSWHPIAKTLSAEPVLNYSTKTFLLYSMESFEFVDTRCFSCNEQGSMQLLFRTFSQERKELSCRVSINQVLILWERDNFRSPFFLIQTKDSNSVWTASHRSSPVTVLSVSS